MDLKTTISSLNIGIQQLTNSLTKLITQYRFTTKKMLRACFKKNLFNTANTRITPRLFSTSGLRLNAADDASKPNGHTHNGAPCSGHSHSHNHSHNHSHGGLNGQNAQQALKMDKPMLMLAFTCKQCDTRSSHVVSKQAYQDGTVLVQCPGCKSRHLIADHLKIFSDNRITLEDIMKAQGETVSTDTSDLVFEDIPESLRKLIGHHASDAPEEYRNKEENPLKIKGDSEGDKTS